MLRVSPYKYSTFHHPWLSEYQKSQANKECFKPIEFIELDKKINIEESYLTKVVVDYETKRKNNEYYNKLLNRTKTKKEYIEELKAIGSFTPSESRSILDQAIYHSLRAKDWSNENIKKCGAAAKFIQAAMPVGVLRAFAKHLDFIPGNLKKIVNLVDGLLLGLRGKFQYDVIGGRHDDDRAQNNYEAENYGNKVSGFFGNATYLLETVVNPVMFPITALFGENIQKGLMTLLELPNIQWWRIRMPAEINQGFATDLLSYMFLKPLSFYTDKNPQSTGDRPKTNILKKVHEIEERGNLKPEYIKERMMKLIGLDPEESKWRDVPKVFMDRVKKVVKGGNEEKIYAAQDINGFLAPILGLYGFFMTSVTTPVKGVLKLFGKNNRVVNALSQTAISSQQLLYTFRFLVPEYLENENQPEVEMEALNDLKRNRKKLYGIGALTAGMNMVSPFLKLLNFQNPYLNIAKDIYDDSSDKLIQYFLSERRKYMGEDFKLCNPELYSDFANEVEARGMSAFEDEDVAMFNMSSNN